MSEGKKREMKGGGEEEGMRERGKEKKGERGEEGMKKEMRGEAWTMEGTRWLLASYWLVTGLLPAG